MTTEITFPTFADGGGHCEPGDSSNTYADGFDLIAVLRHDDLTTPGDFECYDEDEQQAFARGEWQFVGITVQALQGGQVLGEMSIWGYECNLGDDNDHLAQEAASVATEALAIAQDHPLAVPADLGDHDARIHKLAEVLRTTQLGDSIVTLCIRSSDLEAVVKIFGTS